MKKGFKISLALLASVTLVSTSVPLVTYSVPNVLAISETQSQRLLSLGGSLNEAQRQQTMQLLGATNVSVDNTVYVDGTIINQYLQDGSGPGTVVYSSAFIESQPEGYGVQVQVVTPQNITMVSPTTYQNAAITAGAKNVLIRIATVSPVTGEGALAGVYALLEQSGVVLNQQSIQVAEKEIQIVQQVKEEASLTDEQANDITTQIKTEIINHNINVGEVTEQDIVTIVENTINNTIDNSETNISENVINVYVEFANEFAETEQAQDVEVVEQLETSNSGQAWSTTLASLEGAMAPEELLAADRPDYSDAATYHPAIQALSNRFYELVQAGEAVETLYAHTFVLESMQPNLSTAEKDAINQLRTSIYQYAANSESEREQAAASAGVTYLTLKDQWLQQIYAAENLRGADPVLAGIIQRIANASGLAPEVFSYAEMTQDEEFISFFVRQDAVSHASLVGTFEFNLMSGEIVQYDEITGAPVILSSTFDFMSVYGVSVENQYLATEIPADYTIPGYVASEEVEEESEMEETSEEVVEETSGESELPSIPEDSSESEESSDLPESEESVQEDTEEETNGEV